METEKMRKKGWGGAREGAGRHCAGAEKRVTIGVRVAPETAAKLTEYSKKLGISHGKLLDKLCRKIDQICIESD